MTIRIGRLTFKEKATRPFEESWDPDGRQVTLSGILTSDMVNNRSRVAQIHDDILGLPNSTVPVILLAKSSRNGYYRVTGSKSALIELSGQNFGMLSWEVSLVRAGSASEVDLESRLAGPTNKANDFSLSGERWNAPPVPHTAYWSASDTPGIVTRTGEDGAIKVYRSLSTGTNPRWQCPVIGYELGRVRLIANGERFGTGIDPGLVWVMENSLVRVTPNGTGFDLQVHNGIKWSTAKTFNLTVAGSALGAPIVSSVVHHEYERVTVRCLWNRSPNGRVTADITMRRGSRIVELLLRSNSSTTLGVVRATNEAATAGSGFVRGTSNDGDGHRYVIGSSKTFTNDLVAGGLSKASVTRLDAFIGEEIAGSAAVAGDQAANLMAQYLGSPSEVVMAVRR